MVLCVFFFELFLSACVSNNRHLGFFGYSYLSYFQPAYLFSGENGMKKNRTKNMIEISYSFQYEKSTIVAMVYIIQFWYSFFCTIFRGEKVRKSRSSFGTKIFRTILSSIQVWSNFIPFSVCLFLDWIFVQINEKKKILNRQFLNKFFWVLVFRTNFLVRKFCLTKILNIAV